MLLSATSNGVGVNVRLIWEWMDRLCKGLSIPRNQGIYSSAEFGAPAPCGEESAYEGTVEDVT